MAIVVGHNNGGALFWQELTASGINPQNNQHDWLNYDQVKQNP